MLFNECHHLPHTVTNTSLLTQNGESALMIAARCGKTETVVELVKTGANVHLQDKVGC